MKLNNSQKLASIDLINQFKTKCRNPAAILELIKNPKIALKKFISPVIDVKLKTMPPEQALNELQKAWIELSAVNPIRTHEFNIETFLENVGINSFKNPNKLLRMKNAFDLNGSDKATKHNYHRIYQPIIDSLVTKSPKIRILEIGIGTNNMDVPSNMGLSGKPGASLYAFSEYYQDSEIVGLDVDRRILFEENRIKTYFADQLEPSTFETALLNLENFDLIIDDGLHTPLANINTINGLLPRLKLGGWMVIEDIGYNDLNKSIWNSVHFMLSSSFKSYVVNSQSALVFLIQRTKK